MQKKILIAAIALSLFAIAIVVFTSSNQESLNTDNTFVGKIQNDLTPSLVVENSIQNTADTVTDVANELVNLDTKPKTLIAQEDIPVANEENIVLETPNLELPQNDEEDTVNIDTPLATNTNVEVPKADTGNLTATNLASSEPTTSQNTNSGLAATKPPLESLLFKSGDNNMPAPKVIPKEKNDDLSANKLENTVATESEKTQNIIEPPKNQDNIVTEPAPITPEEQEVKAESPEELTTEQVKPKAETTVAEKAKVLVTSTKLKANGQNRTITGTKLEMNGDLVSLRLEANQALGAKTYILNNPDRVVFDLNAKWDISVPMVISNRMVKSIRVGEQESGTRIVFDMLVPAKKSDVKNIDANTLELTIR